MATRGVLRSGVLKAHTPELAVVQRLIDAGVVVGTHVLWWHLYQDQAWGQNSTVATAVALVAFLLVAEIAGLYRTWRGAPLRQDVIEVLVTWGITVPILLFAGFTTKSTEEFSRIVTSAWFLSAPLVMILWRAGLRTLLRNMRARGHNVRTVAIAGSTDTGAKLAKTIQAEPQLGLRVVGIYDDRNRRRQRISDDLGEFAGRLDQLVDAARGGSIDLVFIALPLRAEQRITALVNQLADTTATVHLVPEFHAYDLLHARWGTIGDIQVVSIFDSPFQGLGGWVKRLEDLVIGSMIIVIIAIPMVVIAVLIKLDSKGPVLFRQTRYGLHGKAIRVWKFRSMKVCEDGNDVKQAQPNDARITRLGAFLRRTSLDELPQFFNVIAGDMSIVGPRPHAVAHNELYRGKIHGYMLRHKVRPGITGWAQVNGWRGETDTMEKMEKRIEHDLYYIHNWRLDWDLKIILLTVFGKGVRKNAY